MGIIVHMVKATYLDTCHWICSDNYELFEYFWTDERWPVLKEVLKYL